jgi:putative transposase
MEKNKLELVKTPEEVGEKDSLTELLRIGAKSLIAQAVEAELDEMLSSHSDKLEDARRSVVRNGYLPSRTIETGIGEVAIRKCNTLLVKLRFSSQIKPYVPNVDSIPYYV